MKLYTINTGNFKLDGGAMFGVVPKAIWNKLQPADENNLCNWAMRCLLMEEGNRLILIDCGIGNKQDEKFLGHYFLNGNDSLDASLASYGFNKNDITDVFLTHLHFDHCGGAIEKNGDALVPAFKNATYWSNQQHWEWAVNPNEREKASFLKENILPIASSGQLQFIHQPNDSNIVPSGMVEGLNISFAYGHTDAMMLPMVQYKGSTLVFMADLLPSAAHMPLPYIMAYDMFPFTTLQEKKLFLNTAYENNYLLYFEHDPVYECCSLKMTDKGIRPDTFFRLNEL